MCNDRGEVSERLKELASKASVGETRPWVQIPPSPPTIRAISAISLLVTILFPVGRRTLTVLTQEPFEAELSHLHSSFRFGLRETISRLAEAVRHRRDLRVNWGRPWIVTFTYFIRLRSV
jgi:hypothetical protein